MVAGMKKMLLVLVVFLLLAGSSTASADSGGPRYLGQSSDLTVVAGTPATFAACWVRDFLDCRVVTVAYGDAGRYLIIIPGPENTYAFAILAVTVR